MSHTIQNMLPADIEACSFAMITEELGDFPLAPGTELVVKRVIHTTADFDYAKTLTFTPGAVEAGRAALAAGVPIVTDTQMAKAGINKTKLAAFGSEAFCFMADADVAEAAAREGVTRARKAVDKAAALHPNAIFAVGNAPTALVRLCELMEAGEIEPALVIGVPVGFVHVVESKELLLASGAPCIAAVGRKGGSNVAAAICNAILYSI